MHRRQASLALCLLVLTMTVFPSHLQKLCLREELIDQETSFTFQKGQTLLVIHEDRLMGLVPFLEAVNSFHYPPPNVLLHA